MEFDMKEIERKCLQLRRELIDMLYKAQTGHPGGSLSVVEILTSIYYINAAVKPDDPKWQGRDRVVLSKGHAVPMLYLILADLGFFSKDACRDFRQCGSILPGHPSAKTTPGIDLASGPLGLGLSAGAGMALAQKMDGSDANTYVVLGDGELNEGTIWEGFMSVSKFNINNLITIIDYNGVQLDGACEQIMPMGDLSEKIKSFGLNVITLDGHSVAELSSGIRRAKEWGGAPTVIIAKTVKGKGISFMEGKHSWHGKPINEQEYAKATEELGRMQHVCGY